MLLQMLVGAWPLLLDQADVDGMATFRERMAGWQQKSLREAKRRTDWATPDEDYEAACGAYLDALLAVGATRTAIAEFAARLAVPGAINALSQTLLRLTTPGIPDLYQGAVGWDESLVDPDNRHPLDFAAVRAMVEFDTPNLSDWRSGACKRSVIARVLRHRRETPEMFADARYAPVKVLGPRAAHVVAFLRARGRRQLLVAAVRLPGALVDGARTPTVPPSVWEGTHLVLPTPSRGAELLTGRDLGDLGTTVGLEDVFSELPIALVALC
jgi:(1->4)-alpha-D-glucan 1-alpha-D-glucosylmutase